MNTIFFLSASLLIGKNPGGHITAKNKKKLYRFLKQKVSVACIDFFIRERNTN